MLFSPSLYASSGGNSVMVEFINYYSLILRAVGFDEHQVHALEPVAGSLFSLLVILALGIAFKISVGKNKDNVVPGERFSLRILIEIITEIPYSLGKDFCGKEFEKYLPLLLSLFLFILISNLSGLLPGFPPPTDNINTNLAMGLMVFFVYNFAGIKEHKAHYVKQFMGPVLFIAPLYIVIETFSHLSRPFSLSLRLMGNIFGDHLILTVFTGLTYLVIPGILMFFGLLVSCVQSYVFTLLSSLYIYLAISHDH